MLPSSHTGGAPYSPHNPRRRVTRQRSITIQKARIMATKKLTVPGLEKGQTIMRIPPSSIIVDEVDNGRRNANEDITTLVDALVQLGRQLHPVGVQRTPEGGLKLVWGYRRWKAISHIVDNQIVQAGEPLSMLECIVMDNPMTEAQAFEFNVVENMGRKALTPIDMAIDLSRLTTEFGYTLKTAGAMFDGRSKAWASSMIRLLELPHDVQRKIDTGAIPVSAAYDVLTMPEGPERDAAMAALQSGDGTTRSKVAEAARQKQQEIADGPEAPAETDAKPAKKVVKRRTLKELAVVIEGLRTKYTTADVNNEEQYLPAAQMMDEFIKLMGGGSAKRFERELLALLGV